MRGSALASSRLLPLGILLAFLFIATACESMVSPDEPGESMAQESSLNSSASPSSELGPAGSIHAWGPDLATCCVISAPSGDDFVDIAAGVEHNVALRADGSLAAWGYVGFGRIQNFGGLGRTGFVEVAAGEWHSLALHEDGTIYATGGIGFPEFDFGQASDIPSDDDFTAIAAGPFQSIALREDGTISAWGLASDPPPGDGFVAIAASAVMSNYYALHEDGHIVNESGSSPDYLEGSDFVALDYGIGLREDGTIASPNPSAPTGDGFVDVAPGLALHEDGSLTAWGRDADDAPTGNNFVAIASGMQYLAIEAAQVIVDIEVKSGPGNGNINARSNASIPVAILSDNGFNAPDEVNTESLTFGVTGEEESLHMRGNGPHCSLGDANSNGMDDLVCRFRMAETGLSGGDDEAILMGETYDGIEIKGHAELDMMSPGNGPPVSRGGGKGR